MGTEGRQARVTGGAGSFGAAPGPELNIKPRLAVRL